MQLPIPTDNIYKFLAIFGLTLAISSVVFAHNELEKYKAAEGELSKLRIETSLEETIIEKAFSQFDAIKKELKEKGALSQTVTSEEMGHLSDAVAKLKLEVGTYRKIVEGAVPRREELGVLQRYRIYYFFAAGALFIVGALTSAWGFRRWRADSNHSE